MDIEKLNTSNTPIVRIDKDLDKYADKIMFPKKVEAAKETMKRAGLPKSIKTIPADSILTNARKDGSQKITKHIRSRIGRKIKQGD